MKKLVCNSLRVLGGDINIIISVQEKKGGNSWLDSISMEFDDLIETFCLVDIPIINGCFTWNNRRGEESNIFWIRSLSLMRRDHPKRYFYLSFYTAMYRFGSLAS